jgi:hypothetical protein
VGRQGVSLIGQSQTSAGASLIPAHPHRTRASLSVNKYAELFCRRESLRESAPPSRRASLILRSRHHSPISPTSLPVAPRARWRARARSSSSRPRRQPRSRSRRHSCPSRRREPSPASSPPRRATRGRRSRPRAGAPTSPRPSKSRSTAASRTRRVRQQKGGRYLGMGARYCKRARDDVSAASDALCGEVQHPKRGPHPPPSPPTPTPHALPLCPPFPPFSVAGWGCAFTDTSAFNIVSLMNETLRSATLEALFGASGLG